MASSIQAFVALIMYTNFLSVSTLPIRSIIFLPISCFCHRRAKFRRIKNFDRRRLDGRFFCARGTETTPQNSTAGKFSTISKVFKLTVIELKIKSKMYRGLSCSIPQAFASLTMPLVVSVFIW